MTLPGFGSLAAQQVYELVLTKDDVYEDTGHRYRVSTRDYNYRLKLDAGHEIRWHWHPQGNSPEHRPHIHPSFDLNAHMPCGRTMIEEIVETCIELGARPGRDDWKAQLMESGSLHELYRSWSHSPDEPNASRTT